MGGESSTSSDDGGGGGGVMFSVGGAGNGQEENLGFDPTAEGNIYDVSTKFSDEDPWVESFEQLCCE